MTGLLLKFWGKAFFKRPLRVIAQILSVVIATGLVFALVAAASYDPFQEEYRILRNYDQGDYYSFFAGGTSGITKSDVAKIQSVMQCDYSLTVDHYLSNLSDFLGGKVDSDFTEDGTFVPSANGSSQGFSVYSKPILSLFQDVVCIKESSLSAFNMEVCYGRMPQVAEEVAIPLCLFRSFQAYGYVDATSADGRDSEPQEIVTEADIIGKKIRLWNLPQGSVIVGIVDTHVDRAFFQEHFKGIKLLANQFADFPQAHVLVSEAYLENYVIPEMDANDHWGRQGICATSLTILRPTTDEGFRRIVELLTPWIENQMLSFSASVEGQDWSLVDPTLLDYSAATKNKRYSSIQRWTQYTPLARQALPYAASFSVLYMAYLFYGTYNSKQKGLNTLSSLGTPRRLMIFSYLIFAAGMCIIGCALGIPLANLLLDLTINLQNYNGLTYFGTTDVDTVFYVLPWSVPVVMACVVGICLALVWGAAFVATKWHAKWIS